MALNWSAHINYWLAQGVGVRNRISAISRRFGSFGGSGVWEMFRLFQGAYLPTVYYGLEWLTNYKDYVARIQVHVNNTLRHLFRMPIKLANNILLAKMGTPPVCLQGHYLQRCCFVQMMVYRFCDDFPWFGDIRNDWEFDNYEVSLLSTDRSTDNIPDIMIHDDKATSSIRHSTAIDLAVDEGIHIIYMDGSHGGGHSGATWLQYDRGMTMGAIGHSLPPLWSALECEIYARYGALSTIDDRLPILLFSHCQPAIQLLHDLPSSGSRSGILHLFADVLSRVGPISIGWVPGHLDIPGNVYVDHEAKRVAQLVPNPVHSDGITFGIRNDMIANELRRLEWAKWHSDQGHGYYDRGPRKPRHLQGPSRLDLFVLIRIRSGTGVKDHDSCAGHELRFHLVSCERFASRRPDREMLFDDKSLAGWVDWWRWHDYLGFNVLAHKSSLGGVQIVGVTPPEVLYLMVVPLLSLRLL
ncbi:hypothetical protein L873DRAFT_1915427 [Choiromyces venosus 120613-1]|uniref:RNase H type-1 domain-containing protein n=1 Tax=Choiromyces venosus 120613-1 TaxID=1336337 RepID=A0A3N4JL68_9PEZI|nr:hypothetical protein L873DRAFT_1915427 [Choiromyces venosus 120613-1]